MLLTEKESINADLAKCKSKQGNRPMWVIAAEFNAKPYVQPTRRIAKETYKFTGC